MQLRNMRSCMPDVELAGMPRAAPILGSTVIFSWMCLWLEFFSVQQCYLVA